MSFADAVEQFYEAAAKVSREWPPGTGTSQGYPFGDVEFDEVVVRIAHWRGCLEPLKAGDVVTIAGGTRWFEIVRLEDGYARVFPVTTSLNDGGLWHRTESLTRVEQFDRCGSCRAPLEPSHSHECTECSECGVHVEDPHALGCSARPS